MTVRKENQLVKNRILNRVFYKDYAPNTGKDYFKEVEEKDFLNFEQFLNHNLQNIYLRVDKGKLLLGYEDLLDEKTGFPEKNIESRFNHIKEEMNLFLQHDGYSLHAECNDILLGYAIIDYFTDVKRLKEFHNIENTNSAKIYAYMAYWLLREKPIQIKDNISYFNLNENLTASEANRYLYLNEKFVATYIISNILSDLNVNLNYVKNADKLQDSIGEFMSLLIYNFKYRNFNAQNIELMITSFKSGFNLNNY